MPTLADERGLAPRSVVMRHKPLQTDQGRGPDQRIIRTRRSHTDAQTTFAPTQPDDLDQEEAYRPRQRGTAPDPRRVPPTPMRTRQRFHPLFFVGVGLLIMPFGGIALSVLGSWWQTTQDDWHYGRQRTFQVNAVVGHHDSSQNPSHFIAMNLNRQLACKASGNIYTL